jgi:hypothetical protein
MRECRQYFSDRNFPLVYEGEPPEHGYIILTVENYMKWYTLYAVLPDGSAQPYWPDGEFKETDGFYGDHVFNPDLCEQLEGRKCRTLGNRIMTWDDCSLDMIHGRWIRDRR